VEGEGAAAGVDWAALRELWLKAAALCREMHEAYLRTLAGQHAAVDDGAGLLRMCQFILIVAKQQLDEQALVVDEALAETELGATIGSQLKRLFSNLGLGQGGGKPGAAAARAGGGKGGGNQREVAGGAREIQIEEEIVAWVASRVAPATLGNLMTRHQARAYGRAAGFKSACELLRVTEGAPQLQSRVLATLGEVLSGTAAGEQRAKGGHAKGGWGAGLSRLAVHHTRDTLCAGPHASGKLRLGFAALLERLVQHLEVR